MRDSSSLLSNRPRLPASPVLGHREGQIRVDAPRESLEDGRRAVGVVEVTTRSVTVVNPLGLHARAAARFVHIATQFESRIRVRRDTRVMDGKSIMGILLLAASRGTTLTVIAEGPDEDRAVDALVELVESGFGEESWNA